jgi:hypothetical protein
VRVEKVLARVSLRAASSPKVGVLASSREPLASTASSRDPAARPVPGVTEGRVDISSAQRRRGALERKARHRSPGLGTAAREKDPCMHCCRLPALRFVCSRGKRASAVVE